MLVVPTEFPIEVVPVFVFRFTLPLMDMREVPLPIVVKPAVLFKFKEEPLMFTVSFAFPMLVPPILLIVDAMSGALQVALVPFKVMAAPELPIAVAPEFVFKFTIPLMDTIEVLLPIEVLPVVVFIFNELPWMVVVFPWMLVVPAELPIAVVPVVVFTFSVVPWTVVVVPCTLVVPVELPIEVVPEVVFTFSVVPWTVVVVPWMLVVPAELPIEVVPEVVFTFKVVP
jgi:hypothetical protein